MRFFIIFAAFCMTSCAGPAASRPAGVVTADSSSVRREPEQWYDRNQRAFSAKDVGAIMALRTDDFHTVAPDGAVRDRAEMEQYTRVLLNGDTLPFVLGAERLRRIDHVFSDVRGHPRPPRAAFP
ncbi:MAG TPA: hypothetical protein VES88_10205 [Gemmatimonadaceae bacterium]|nr:hypothetical protein [Gemmatimonadaceae bacterium]